MSQKQKFDVVREHQGDRDYRQGDVRSAVPADVKHLVDLGVLKPAGRANKADNARKTKAAAPPA